MLLFLSDIFGVVFILSERKTDYDMKKFTEFN